MMTMDFTAKKYRYDKRYWIALAGAIVFLALGCYLNAISTLYSRAAVDGVVLNDLGFKLFPFNPVYPDIADAILLVANIGFGIYAIVKKKFDELPFYLTAVGLIELFRAAILPLTPLTTPVGSLNFGFLGNLLVTGGTFPSGHAGQLFTLFFLIPWRDQVVKWGMFALAIIESFVMIAARGHYTIDVVASFFIAYFVCTVAYRYWAKVKGRVLTPVG